MARRGSRREGRGECGAGLAAFTERHVTLAECRRDRGRVGRALRDCGLPDCVKVFPAGVHGPSGMGALLAPYARERHRGRMIMPTGGVNYENGPQYQEQIGKRGFTTVLGMSSPLELVGKLKRPGDVETIRELLAEFKAAFRPYGQG